MELRVRAARLDDTEAIVAANAALAAETEGLQLDQERLRRGVRQVLADRQKGRYFVAEQEGRVVGQMLVTYEWSDWRDGWMWWLQSVYVAPDQRRRGVFSALYEHVVGREAVAAGVVEIRLYVDVDNGRAQAVYGAAGLQRSRYEVWEASLR